MHALYLRWSDPDSQYLMGVVETPLRDVRGACTAGIETAQTFLAPDEVTALVEEYRQGATRRSLAVKYGIHEQTVGAHVRRARAARPPKVTAEVLAEYAEGVPATVVARRCGVTADTIVRHARSAGITPAPHHFPPEQVEQIVAAYAAGEQIVEIGKRFGMGHRHARQVLVEAGVQIRPRGHRPTLAGREDEIMTLRNQGLSFARIGELLGASPSTVRGVVAAYIS